MNRIRDLYIAFKQYMLSKNETSFDKVILMCLSATGLYCSIAILYYGLEILRLTYDIITN